MLGWTLLSCDKQVVNLSSCIKRCLIIIFCLCSIKITCSIFHEPETIKPSAPLQLHYMVIWSIGFEMWLFARFSRTVVYTRADFDKPRGYKNLRYITYISKLWPHGLSKSARVCRPRHRESSEYRLQREQ